MKILITGTAGFIGYYMAKRMLELGNEVVGIDNINNYYDVPLKHSRLAESGIDAVKTGTGEMVQSKKYTLYRFRKMALEDQDALFRLFESEDFDCVCNLAAQAGVRYSLENPKAIIDSNITGFLNILEACRKFPVKHLIYASSSSVYGNSAVMPLSTKHRTDSPVSLYAASKKSNELMAHTYSHLFNIPSTGLRFFTVYGPWGRPDMAYFSFTKAIFEGEPIKVFNRGDLYRDFTYINDIVDGIVKVIGRPVDGEQLLAKVYNIGNSAPVNLLYFIETLENIIEKKAVKDFYPMQPGDVYKTFADIAEFEKDFSYKPHTAIEIGLTGFVNWYRNYYKI
jgi:UDP-glucuronate 4-epimerase